MTESGQAREKASVQKCVPSWDTRDPLQEEVTRIRQCLKHDILGIEFLGNDGVLRTLTADRKVLSAHGLSKHRQRAIARHS
jgi:hypothetical protein